MNLSDIKNEDLRKFMTAIGGLTEIWAFAFNNFMKHFNNDKVLAMEATSAFMHTIMFNVLLNSDEREE